MGKSYIYSAALEEGQNRFAGPHVTLFPSYLFWPGLSTAISALQGQRNSPVSHQCKSFSSGSISPGNLQPVAPAKSEALFSWLMGSHSSSALLPAGSFAPVKLPSHLLSQTSGGNTEYVAVQGLNASSLSNLLAQAAPPRLMLALAIPLLLFLSPAMRLRKKDKFYPGDSSRDH